MRRHLVGFIVALVATLAVPLVAFQVVLSTTVTGVTPAIGAPDPGVFGVAPAAPVWVKPVAANPGQPFKPGIHLGVDLPVVKGTPIHAASAGVVDVVTCQATLNGVAYSCDQDGSASVQGCGWYVRIHHADNIWTLYCHMVQQPLVVKGQQVQVGDVIGLSGTSGNSSGPHVHFQVMDGCGDNSCAIDPVPFMADRGAPLSA